MLILVGIILFYLVCVVFYYGLFFAYWQKKYPEHAETDYKKDMKFSMKFSIWCSIFGPIPLIIICNKVKSFRYGLKFW